MFTLSYNVLRGWCCFWHTCNTTKIVNRQHRCYSCFCDSNTFEKLSASSRLHLYYVLSGLALSTRMTPQITVPGLPHSTRLGPHLDGNENHWNLWPTSFQQTVLPNIYAHARAWGGLEVDVDASSLAPAPKTALHAFASTHSPFPPPLIRLPVRPRRTYVSAQYALPPYRCTALAKRAGEHGTSAPGLCPHKIDAVAPTSVRKQAAWDHWQQHEARDAEKTRPQYVLDCEGAFPKLL